MLRATRVQDQVRERIRYKHYSLRTEQAYVQWVRVFVKWLGLRHLRDMGRQGIEGFLNMFARAAGGGYHAQILKAAAGRNASPLVSLAAWLNDGFGAFIWMTAQGRKPPLKMKKPIATVQWAFSIQRSRSRKRPVLSA